MRACASTVLAALVLLAGCTGSSAHASSRARADAYLRIRPDVASEYEVAVYYFKESTETAVPLSPQQLLKSYSAQLRFDTPEDVASFAKAVSQTRKVRRESAQLNARWAIIFQNPDHQELQAFYIDPRGWVSTGGAEYVTDGTLLAFLRKKLDPVIQLLGR